MEENQSVASEASNITEIPPSDHASVAEAGCENLADASSEAVGSSSHDMNVDSHVTSSITENIPLGMATDAENVAGEPNTMDYSYVNGNAGELGSDQSDGVTGNEVLCNGADGPFAEQHLEVNSAEEDRLWGMVMVNCLDFNAWTALIDETEKVAENNIIKIRKVYDMFLAEFPLCFGYWKKYADHEGRLDSVDKVVEVYERAILAVTYSVDIWLHYCVFAISTYEDPDIIRRLFERGLAYVGTDYLSSPLWDEYIRYEEAHQAWNHLAMIYTRILENPIQQLDRYFNCFKELAASRPLSEIRTAEEAALAAASVESASQGLEREVHPDAVEQSSKPASAGLTEAEELEKYIAIREEMSKKAKEFESKIIDFEAIKRPYFHIRSLDDPELENWHKYLDFIEGEGDLNKVVRLYERCLIACASYPEYWIRYVLSMESSGNMELADNALARATQVFVKKQPEIHLFAAKFKELCGDVMGARAEYQLLYSEVSPCLVEAIVKHANMEYRLGNKEAAFSLYEKIIAAEQEKKQSQTLPLLLVQYSRFLYLVAGNVEKARDTLFGPLDHVKLSKPLLEAVIHLESILPPPKRIDSLDSLVEKFIAANQDISNMASATEREEISCIFMEFLDLFGDAQSIKKADSRHAKVFLRHKRTLGSKKRQADDFLASDKEKVSRMSTSVSSSSQPVMGAYPSAQNQWPSGYEQNVQSWPQNSQAQGQAWDPSYTQQAGYNAYGYANYGPPQMPTAAPQTAPYGSYVPTYPAQAAYPVQNYAQPSAPAATAFPQQQAQVATSFPQQQAPAAQPYYGYY